MTSSAVASGGEGQANLNLWLKDVSVYVPGIHRSVLKRQLILACREFFEQSQAWQQTMGPLTVVPQQETYMLSPLNSTTDVVAVKGVWVNGIPVPALPSKPHYPPNYPTGGEVSLLFGYWMVRPDVMALAPVPNPVQVTTMELLVALKPKQTVKQVPHIAVSDFYDAILAGVLYRVLNQPGKPYSNPALSMQFESRFRTLIGTYAAKAKTGYNGSATWRFPYFGSPRHWGR